jgi:hypothetical protein
MKKSNGTLRGGDFYPGHMAVIKGSAFVNSTIVGISPSLDLNSDRSPDILHRDLSDRHHSEAVECVSCYN